MSCMLSFAASTVSVLSMNEMNFINTYISIKELKRFLMRTVFLYQTMVSFMLQFVRTMIRKKWIHI